MIFKVFIIPCPKTDCTFYSGDLHHPLRPAVFQYTDIHGDHILPVQSGRMTLLPMWALGCVHLSPLQCCRDYPSASFKASLHSGPQDMQQWDSEICNSKQPLGGGQENQSLEVKSFAAGLGKWGVRHLPAHKALGSITPPPWQKQHCCRKPGWKPSLLYVHHWGPHRLLHNADKLVEKLFCFLETGSHYVVLTVLKFTI